MVKSKILFVVDSFYRAGAERFAYEVNRGLNKNIFDVSIFSLERESDLLPNWSERYYYGKHLKLGSEITFSDRFRAKEKKLTVLNRILRKLSLNSKTVWKEQLYTYLNQYDVIHWMGEYTYIHTVPKNIRNKSLIQPMSAKFQNDKIYDNFNFELFYNFCSLFSEDEIPYEFSQFKNYHYIIIPLVLKIETYSNKWKYVDSKIKKIGIFTRLSKDKPLDPFFYSFQLLLDTMPDCELHIFGYGDPKLSGMTVYLERLGIADKVFFRGHQENIVNTAIEENLNLCWFQGYNNDRPAGYAGIDICTTGIPLLCWDFHPSPKKFENMIYPHFKNLRSFTSFSLNILNNREKAEFLSNMQFVHTIESRDIKKSLPILEQEYLRIQSL